MKRYISYENVNSLLRDIYKQLRNREFTPDLVVGLVRGGLVPAVRVSHEYDIPLVAFKYSLRDHPGQENFDRVTAQLGNAKRILIVDELCDGGHTLLEVRDLFKKNLGRSYEIRTAVLHYNESNKLIAPDFYGEAINKEANPEWLVYPWE